MIPALQIATLALASVLATAHAAERRASALPADAARLRERIELCGHFAGEFNGERSERDREVSRAMDRLRCGRLERDVRAMRRRYPRNPKVQAALDAADEL